MSSRPLVSIIMPAYNCERFIEKAIDSVQKQTYTNWELIVINDSSKDATYEMVQRKANYDDRIHLYDNEQNMGVSKTRNRGVSIAKGDWIAFLDSDDIWEARKLEKQISLIENNENVAICFTGSAFINEEGEPANYILHVPENVTYKELLKQNVISCSSVLLRKKYYLKYKMPDGDLHEDFALWLMILREEKKAYGIDEPLLVYRIYANSKSGNKIHAAKMQWNVYKYIGLTVSQRIYYMCCYTVRNLKKYKKIHESI